MSHLETDSEQFIEYQSAMVTIQRVVSTIAILVLAYYLQQYVSYETTIRRSISEFTSWLIPKRSIRLVQRMLGGYTNNPNFVHHGTRQVLGTAREESAVTGFGTIIQKARSMSGIDKIVSPSMEVSFTGLGNLDNSCYQNSVLQGLASLDNFQKFIDSSAEQSYELKIRADTQYALYHFIAELRQERVGRTTTWTPGDLKSMDSWQQQDAQEYFSKIMDLIEKESVRVQAAKYRKCLQGLESLRIGGPMAFGLEDCPVGTGSRQATCKPKDTSSPVDGLLAQRLVCQTCNTSEGITFMPFNCLTLNLGSANATHLEDLLTSYTDFELLEGIECDECTIRAHPELESEPVKLGRKNRKKKKTTSSGDIVISAALDQPSKKQEKVRSTKAKEIRFGRLPQDLVVHINRSIFDMYGNQRKNSSAVEFPARLEIMDNWMLSLSADFDDIDAMYDLRCVVTHYGRHDNGHYIAYGKRGKEWYEFNDAKVRRVEEEEVLSCGSVFMLFYEIVAAAPVFELKKVDAAGLPTIKNDKAEPTIDHTELVDGLNLDEKERDRSIELLSPNGLGLPRPA